jgi:hypothetical protein
MLWVAEGWRMFRAAPLGWLLLVFAYLMGTMVVSFLPLIGPAVVSLLVPAISVGFMAAARASSRGQAVELPMLVAGFRERLPAQLVLGCVYGAGFAAALAGSALADGGALLGLLFAPAGTPPAAAPGNPLAGMLAAVLIYLPTLMLLWFAPVLVAWHALAPGKALFYSAVAFWLNRRAFVVYALTPAASLFVIVGTATLLSAALEAPAASARSLVFPMALLVLPTLFASYYASYRDVFGAGEKA